MKEIRVYDIEAEDIAELSDKHDVTEASIIEALMEAVRNGDIDIEDYL